MKNKKIKSVQFNEINPKKNKYRASLINFQSNKKQKKSVQLISSKKLAQKRNMSLIVNKSKSSFRYSKIINLLKKNENNIEENKENEENKNTKTIMTYTEIRQHIYKKLKKGYISPYIEKFHINQNYIEKTEYDSFYLEPAKYYDYYQICYLTNKNIKHYSLLSRLHDHLMLNDDQEYIMKYFSPEEFYINMKYLLYYFYDKDKLLTANISKNEYVDKNISLGLYKKWNENIFRFEDSFDIFNNGRKFLKFVISEPFRHRLYFTRLNAIFKSNINYVYVQDMPKEFIHNCIPNLFPHISKDIYNLKIYINIKMNNNKENIEQLLDKTGKEKSINKFYRNSINRNELRKGNRHKSFCNDNICKNISFSSKDEKEESNSILPMEKIYNNSINNGNKDYKDIKYFLQKLLNSKIQKLNEEEKFEQSKKLYKKIEKMNSIKNKEEEESKLDFIKLFTNNSLIETKKKIKTNNKNLFLKLAKRELFKMSFNKTNSLSKTNRNTSDKSTIYNPNSSINENNIKINYENNLNHLTRNRQNKKILKVKEKEKEKENLNKDEKKLFLIKSKTSSEKTVNKNIINSYQENFQRTFSETKINKIRNNNTKYIKALSCNDLTSKYHIHNIKKNFRIINRQINKDQIFSLNNFEKLYNETKIKGLLPKTEIKYNLFYQPFKGVYGHNYFLDLLNKKRNDEEINKEYKEIEAYGFEKVKRDIKMMEKNDILFFKNNYSLESIIKCPSIYLGNN